MDRAGGQFDTNGKISFLCSSRRQFGYHCQSLSQLRSVVSELEGALASILKDLKRIHNMFFNELANDLAGRDVRQVLKMVRGKS